MLSLTAQNHIAHYDIHIAIPVCRRVSAQEESLLAAMNQSKLTIRTLRMVRCRRLLVPALQLQAQPRCTMTAGSITLSKRYCHNLRTTLCTGMPIAAIASRCSRQQHRFRAPHLLHAHHQHSTLN